MAQTQEIVTRFVLHTPLGIAIEADGQILVTNSTLEGIHEIIRVDPVTGDQAIVTTGVGIFGINIVLKKPKK